MNLLRRTARALNSTTGAERTLYTVAVGYVVLAVLEAVRYENTAAVIGYCSATFLALCCALMSREAAERARIPEGPLDGRGCALVAFHGGPLDGGAGMVSHSHEPGARVHEVIVPVDGGRYVATSVESTMYRLEFEADEVTTR